MTGDLPTSAKLARLLDLAAELGVCISPIARRHALDLPQAYEVQAALVARRIARGERLVGLKLGFTSQAMRAQMGIASPNIGWLTDAMALPNGGCLRLSRFTHPRIEPEVALKLGKDLHWPAGPDEIAAAVAACAPALEVVDSRFHNYKFTLEDNVADNSSAAGFVIGDWRRWPIEIGGRKVALHRDRQVAETGSTEAVMGHPLNSLLEGVRLAGEVGHPLRAGMIVLTGGVTSAHPAQGASHIGASFEGLGELGISIEP